MTFPRSPFAVTPYQAFVEVRPLPPQFAQGTCFPPITGTLPCRDQNATVFLPMHTGHFISGACPSVSNKSR
jgi:hypothetical protein